MALIRRQPWWKSCPGWLSCPSTILQRRLSRKCTWCSKGNRERFIAWRNPPTFGPGRRSLLFRPTPRVILRRQTRWRIRSRYFTERYPSSKASGPCSGSQTGAPQPLNRGLIPQVLWPRYRGDSERAQSRCRLLRHKPHPAPRPGPPPTRSPRGPVRRSS